MAATLRDVAKLAGVSFRTVSNVVNDYPYISEGTRARVQAAIDELGYRPNHSARSLRLGRSNTIGLAVPSLKFGYFAELAADIIEAARGRGFVVLTEQTNGDRALEVDAVTGTRRQMTDGLLINPTALGVGDADLFLTEQPVVLLGEDVYSTHLDHVTTRNEDAARAATAHLAALGRTRIAVVGHGPGLESSGGTADIRMRGYRLGLEDAGLAFDPALVTGPGDWAFTGGGAAIRRLLDAGTRFDAVFAFTDVLAIGAMQELRAAGIDVPREVSVIGFDDLTEGLYVTPTLTTVDGGRRRIAALAVDTLIERITTPDAPGRLIEVDYRIVERGSTAPA